MKQNLLLTSPHQTPCMPQSYNMHAQGINYPETLVGVCGEVDLSFFVVSLINWKLKMVSKTPADDSSSWAKTPESLQSLQ